MYARATQPLGPGKHTVRYEFNYDGGGVGKGGMGTLFVNQQVGEEHLSRTVPFAFSSDFTDFGIDNGSPVTEDYETPRGRFTGEVFLGPDGYWRRRFRGRRGRGSGPRWDVMIHLD